ncbi:RNA 2',3'-cyclic phosphodiesterase [Asaia bogorensis]|uniref:RNA 2',3'-cyclic phosphodiesterase n=1 Tax=Asaia bogorensis NBRC 16594 TaxID=1231624 RepID=A0AAN4R1I1_9PROT|nr:RNA 2',3'-cyclic phosphodiesterase [Asaia bogorensis]BAT20029.1 2'-5' RNA ligase [Asaia bogorensis NBRC 16594]GBQ80696.1 2'-5' RNA ligase [Asaia bogorensis NBRC 16594]GEL52553.1 RNA 2',3'-cyclic phosphodiesterase [Asaia bogorensis NBRC 16594]
MRLFTALDLASEHKRLLSSLRRPIAGVTWHPPETYHLTLRFIGDIRSRPMMEELDHTLAAITTTPVQIEPSGVGIATQGTRSRLWAGVAPSSSLMTLQGKIDTALRRCGLALEKKRFMPHITLGVFDGDPGAEVIRWIQGNNLMRGKPVMTEHFVLFRSHRGGDTPHYETCAEYALTLSALPPLEAWSF